MAPIKWQGPGPSYILWFVHCFPADQPAGGAAGGAGGGQGDEGGPGDNNGSQSDGAGGGAGGDGGDGGDGDDHGNEDQSDSDDHEEEATEETPPSSGNRWCIKNTLGLLFFEEFEQVLINCAKTYIL